MIYTDTLTPTSYATKLATYIDNPTTIRAHVKNYFGRAPSVDICAKLRRDYLKKRDASISRYRCSDRFSSFRCGHPQSDENLLLLRNGIEKCKTCEEARIAEEEAERARKQRAEMAERAARLKAAALRAKIADTKDAVAKLQGVRPRLTSETVRMVADLLGVAVDDIYGSSHLRQFVDARAVCARIFRHAGMSYPQIAKALNRKDHSTSINLIKTFNQRAAARPLLWDVYDAVRGE